MLQQILSEMFVDPELLAELDDEQKQILFCKMREEQVRRWQEHEKVFVKEKKKKKFAPSKKGQKSVQFVLGEDGQPWTWVMGEHKNDKNIEDILEDEARNVAGIMAENEAEQLISQKNEEISDDLTKVLLIENNNIPEVPSKNIVKNEEIAESMPVIPLHAEVIKAVPVTPVPTEIIKPMPVTPVPTDVIEPVPVEIVEIREKPNIETNNSYAPMLNHQQTVPSNPVENTVTSDVPESTKHIMKINNLDDNSRRLNKTETVSSATHKVEYPITKSLSYESKFLTNNNNTNKMTANIGGRVQNGSSPMPVKVISDIKSVNQEKLNAQSLKRSESNPVFGTTKMQLKNYEITGISPIKEIDKSKQKQVLDVNKNKLDFTSLRITPKVEDVVVRNNLTSTSSKIDELIVKYKNSIKQARSTVKLPTITSNISKNVNLISNISSGTRSAKYLAPQPPKSVPSQKSDPTSPANEVIKSSPSVKLDDQSVRKIIMNEPLLSTTAMATNTAPNVLPPELFTPEKPKLRPKPSVDRDSWLEIQKGKVKERLKEQRSSEIYQQITEDRKRISLIAEQINQEQEEIWIEQERKAKSAEKQIRDLARKARELHRRNSEMEDNKPEVKPKPIQTTSRSKDARLYTKSQILEWFEKEEKPKKVAVDLKTGKVAKWFHGIINREQSEHLLIDSPTGTFLVRLNDRIKGYVISYKTSDRCKHYLIDASNGNYQFFGANQIVHLSLVDLVNFHKMKPISSPGQEYLTLPCPQRSEAQNCAGLI